MRLSVNKTRQLVDIFENAMRYVVDFVYNTIISKKLLLEFLWEKNNFLVEILGK